ncbi:MBL fold metallo-hydrolase [Litoribrevibacter euphylliae]|uniref:MBL fold metallo-hydrolase n=1 Tax=Litoribrevibacter euphylliae TaxID=1834034 RepID=A0ABV7HER5_9GAMM
MTRQLLNKIVAGSVIGLAIFSIYACQNQSVEASSDLPAHHLPDGTFQNLYLENSKKSIFKFLWAKYTSDWSDWEGREIHVLPVDLNKEDVTQNFYDKPRISWIGHSTVLVQYKNISVLTDPIFFDRASPVSFAGPLRAFKPAIALEDLPEIDYAIISHNHYDHLDRLTVEAMGESTQWLVPLGLKEWFTEQGVQSVIELDWWEAYQAKEVTLRLTPAQHWSKRTPWDTNESLWGSWQIQIGDFNSWFGGDTGYNDIQFKEIGSKVGPFDFAMIPIGAYEPRWFMKNMHVNPEESVKIHKDIRSSYSMGIHWSTFQLTAEQIDAPREDLKTALSKEEKIMPFEAVPIGSSFEIIL